MDEQGPRLKTTKQDGTLVVELGETKILDESTISKLGEELLNLASGIPEPKMVLDFANVGHMSSSVLGMLITLHKRLRERGGRLLLCNIRASIYEVFKITRLDQVFDISPDRPEALRRSAST